MDNHIQEWGSTLGPGIFRVAIEILIEEGIQEVGS